MRLSIKFAAISLKNISLNNLSFFFTNWSLFESCFLHISVILRHSYSNYHLLYISKSIILYFIVNIYYVIVLYVFV